MYRFPVWNYIYYLDINSMPVKMITTNSPCCAITYKTKKIVANQELLIVSD